MRYWKELYVSEELKGQGRGDHRASGKERIPVQGLSDRPAGK